MPAPMRVFFIILLQTIALGVMGGLRPQAQTAAGAARTRSASPASQVPASQAPASRAPASAGRAAAQTMAASAAADPASSSSSPEQDHDRRLRALAAEAAALAKEQHSLLGELRELELVRQTRGIELAKTTEALAIVSAQSAATAARAAQASHELDALRPLVRARLVRLYKLGRLGYSRLLLDQGEVRAFRETTQVVGAMARRDRALLERYRTTLATLTDQRARLESQRREAAALEATLEGARAALDRAVAARAARVKTIQSRQDLNRRLTAELEAARGKLDASVAGLTGASPGASASTATAGAGTAGSASTTATSSASYAWPIGGPALVSSTFGRERTSRFGTQIARNGIQIDGTDGQRVQAARDGTVAFADVFQGFGQLVIIEHGPRTFTLYGHLASMTVVRGDRVQQGQPVGTVGRTPTGESALYFELRIDGRPVDPVRWLKR